MYRINCPRKSKVVYKASCWDCQDVHIGKTKRRLRDRKTEHFKVITSGCLASAIADQVTSRHHFQIIARGQPGTHCKIKETLPIHFSPLCLDTVRNLIFRKYIYLNFRYMIYLGSVFTNIQRDLICRRQSLI